MSDESRSDFLFYLTGTELLEFFEAWPSSVGLAILNSKDSQRFYLLPEESAERDLRRLGKELPAPVFPPLPGVPSISITYAQENEVLHRLADRDDLLDEALRISERLAVAEQAEDLDKEDLEEETPGADQMQPRVQADILVLESLLTGFQPNQRSDAHKISLLRRGKTLQLRVGKALQPGQDEGALVALLDGRGRRLALLTEKRAEVLGLKDVAVQLGWRGSRPVADDYELPSLPGLALLLRRHGREHELTLVGTAPGALVADLSLASRQPPGGGWGKRLMTAAVAASWLLTLAAVGGYYLNVPIGPAQQTDAVLPDFHSKEYVENLINRLFPDNAPAES